MHVPKRNAHTPFSPLHPCRTTDSTSDVSDDSVSYLRPSTMAPASNRTHRLRGGGDTTFTIPDNPSSHDLLAAVFTFCASDGIPPPPASVVDSIINPTSVGNRIAAVQTVLSSEHAQTPVTLSSDQLEAILRIPLSPSPSMPVVDVIALRSDVSTISAPRIPPPSPASLASATIATGTNFPTPSAAVTAAIFCQSTPTTLNGEAEGERALLLQEITTAHFLKATFPDRRHATTAVKAFATSQNKSVKSISKGNNSKTAIYMCSSVVDQKVVIPNHEGTCSFIATFKPSSEKRGAPWCLTRAPPTPGVQYHTPTTADNLRHSPRCPAGPHISSAEYLAAMRPTMLTNLGRPLRDRADACGGGLLSDAARAGLGAVSDKIAYNSMALLKKGLHSDYPFSFSRLPQFLRLFREQNPGSLATIQTNCFHQFVRMSISFKSYADVVRTAGLSTFFLGESRLQRCSELRATARL